MPSPGCMLALTLIGAFWVTYMLGRCPQRAQLEQCVLYALTDLITQDRFEDTASTSQGWTCGNATPHRGQACAPSGGNGLPQPGQCVANRIPQWAQNCQCASISRRQSRHSCINW
jgi:hypothetical protein